MTDAAIRAVVRGHTCEAGVRHLARELGAICQFVACRRVETGDAAPVTVVAGADEAVRLEPTRLHFSVAEILGPPRYDSLPDHVRDALSRERGRVVGFHPADPEAVAAQAWIEVLEELPWPRSAERLDAPARLRQGLDREHVGRASEKDQVLDYLVARQAFADRGAAGAHAAAAEILCLYGSAGTGRTAFAGPAGRAGLRARPDPVAKGPDDDPGAARRVPARSIAADAAGRRHLHSGHSARHRAGRLRLPARRPTVRSRGSAGRHSDRRAGRGHDDGLRQEQGGLAAPGGEALAAGADLATRAGPTAGAGPTARAGPAATGHRSDAARTRPRSGATGTGYDDAGTRHRSAAGRRVQCRGSCSRMHWCSSGSRREPNGCT